MKLPLPMMIMLPSKPHHLNRRATDMQDYLEVKNYNPLSLRDTVIT